MTEVKAKPQCHNDITWKIKVTVEIFKAFLKATHDI